MPPLPPHILDQIPSPCFVVDAAALRENGRVLKSVEETSGAEIILALKAFSMWPGFRALRPYLRGTTASSVHEALLGSLEFGGEVHVYAPAYSDEEFEQLLSLSTHITFNSLSQWERFRERAGAKPGIGYGLRINPGYSEIEVPLYDPCAPGSRFGMTADDLAGADLSGITGLHFHSLCEQGADTLDRTLNHVESQFGDLLHRMDWLNMGGGHHITKPDYDRDLLAQRVRDIRERYALRVILEPGEAVAQEAGVLVSTVQDVFETAGHAHAILDVSATAHMPDVLEMPYRPGIVGEVPVTKGTHGAHAYLLGGNTCLAGDRIGVYAFDHPLQVGERLVFTDMAIYSMVKTTFFNGVQHPAIALWDPETESVEVTRRFGYADFRNRLG